LIGSNIKKISKLFHGGGKLFEDNNQIDSVLPENVKVEDAIAFFRFQVISPMLDAPRGKIDATAKKLAKTKFHDMVNKKQVTFHERTIYQYYMDFKKDGFEGLKPKVYKNKGTHPSIPDKIIKEILRLKEELPTRSAQKIKTMLTLAKKINEDSLHVRTINRILKSYDYTTKTLHNNNRTHVKHEKDAIGDMWQSDVMHAFYLPDGNGDKKLCYLIAFMDDHSRRITHAQFYFDATLTRLEDCLKKAIIKFGAPKTLYIDNGQIYIANNFKLICARLGIRLKYATPYSPEGKGKIEKYWQFVQNSFISEIKNNKIDNIVELNDLFSAWLKKEYHEKIHTSLGTTPLERWQKSLDNGAKLNYFSPVQIDEAFLYYAQRKVTKYGTISFQGNKYEVDGTLIGKKIGLRYNPFHLDKIHIYYQDKYYGLARIIDLDKQKHKDVLNVEEDPIITSDISKQYFDNIKSNYQEYLQQQLDMSINTDSLKSPPDSESDEDEDQNNDDVKYRPAKEKKEIIKRKEFVEIITSSLDMENISFAQKGKLYELWGTFKEFNRDILLSIINDIKDKTPDYNNNFLFYLAQIKKTYLDKTKGGH
jgi:transposase InsO family protein